MTTYKGLVSVTRNRRSPFVVSCLYTQPPQAADRTGQFAEKNAGATEVRKLGHDLGCRTLRLRFLSRSVLKVPKSERILPFGPLHFFYLVSDFSTSVLKYDFISKTP